MRKTSKLLILVAILVMAVGLGSLVGAENATPNLNIEFVNLSFSDNIWLKYAVPYDETNTIKLLVWDAPQSEYLYGTQAYELEYEEIQEINGTDYLVFNFKKQVAKQMYDYVYARAYTNQGGEKVYGNLNKYNVVEYAYKVLGKTSAGINDNKARALASAVLEYGATAQTYLNYKTDTLANADFYQVKLEGGALVLDTCNHGLYLAGTEVEITAPATNENGDAFTNWTDSTGNIVATTSDATITVGEANEVYTANYGSSTPVVTVYKVTFTDWDGIVLKEQEVNSGDSATPPANPSREGYAFAGWEGNYTNVTADVTITAKYTLSVDDFAVIFDSVTASSGDTVDVTVRILNNPGVASMGLNVKYNSDLTLTSISFNSAMGGVFTQPPLTNNPVKLNWYSALSNVEGDYLFVTLTFKISDSAEPGRKIIAATYDPDDVYNIDEDNLDLTVVNGYVTVK